MDDKKSEEQVLFPDVEIEGIKVRPWSFGILFEISSLIEEVLDKAEEKGIDLDFKEDFISYSTIAKLITLASEPLLKIMAITTGASEEDLRSKSLGTGINILATIYLQNSEQVKNALGLQTPTKGTEEEETDKEPESEEVKED